MKAAIQDERIETDSPEAWHSDGPGDYGRTPGATIHLSIRVRNEGDTQAVLARVREALEAAPPDTSVGGALNEAKHSSAQWLRDLGQGR